MPSCPNLLGGPLPLAPARCRRGEEKFRKNRGVESYFFFVPETSKAKAKERVDFFLF